MKDLLARQFKAAGSFLKGRNLLDLVFLAIAGYGAFWLVRIAKALVFLSLSRVTPLAWLVFGRWTLVLATLVVSFFVFVYVLRRLVPGIIATLLLFSFGCAIYHAGGLTKPRELKDGGSFAHGLAVADNALSAFFMSRGSYDYDDDEERNPPGNAPRETMQPCLRTRNPSANAPRAETPSRLRQGWNYCVSNSTATLKGIVPPFAQNAIRSATSSVSGWGIGNAVREHLERVSAAAVGRLQSPTAYYVFHTLCYAYGAAFLCTIFATRLINLWVIWSYLCQPAFVKRQGKRLGLRARSAVFWCDGPESVVTAVQLEARPDHPGHKERFRAIFALRELKPFSLTRKFTKSEGLLNEKWFPWVYVDPRTLKGGWVTSPLFRAEEHYILGPNGQDNVAVAEQLLQNLGPVNLGEPVQIFLRIDADAESDALFQWADKQARGKVEIILVHEPSLVAASLYRKHPLLDAPGIGIDTENAAVTGAFRVLIVGFGAQGKAILRETVQGGVFPGAENTEPPSLDVTVVDARETSYEPLKSIWEEVAPTLDNSDLNDPTCPAEISFGIRNGAPGQPAACDVHSAGFWKWVSGKISEHAQKKEMPWNRVIFALPDDLENLRLALRFEEAYKNAGILDGVQEAVFFAGVRRHENAEYAQSILNPPRGWEEAGNGNGNGQGQSTPKEPSAGSWTKVFGDLDAVYKGLRENMTRWDKGAIALNGTYAAPKPKEIAWKEASFFDKESSRAAVVGMRTLARLVGYKIAEDDGRESPGCSVPELKVDDDLVETLAKTEQLRWNAFLLLRGIRPWHPDAKEVKALAEKRKVKVKPNDQQFRGRHAALVPYGKLKAVDEIFAAGNKAAGFPAPGKVEKKNEDFAKSLHEILAATGWRFQKVEPKQQPETSSRETPADNS